MSDSLRITEIFLSLQGESSTVGLPTVFVRLTGCPLRCVYCDTTYAFKGGENRNIDAIVDEVLSFGVQHVTVTGGEPLAQKRCINLLRVLCDKGLSVSLETSGAIDVSDVDPRVMKVMDLKTPSSGELTRNLMSNLEYLNAQDEVKFVIGDEADYDWSVEQLKTHAIDERCKVLFSPVQGQFSPTELADRIVADRLPVRFQFQLHKLLWGDKPGK
ncbi:MAG: 7-carboxy-7-deazaguanine synthase QueE [Sedimenticolaceae bacterium]|jgi:7-carboxy-7-deazaguanine synthase